MSTSEKTENAQKLKMDFQVTNSAMRSGWNCHYNTAPTSSRLRDNPNKDVYFLNPVPEGRFMSHIPPLATPPHRSPPSFTSPPKCVFKKPNFFSKRDPSSPIQASKPSKTHDKVKNFISSMRQHSKSTCDSPPSICKNNPSTTIPSSSTTMGGAEEGASIDDGVFTMPSNNNSNNNSMQEPSSQLTLSDIQLEDDDNYNHNNYNNNHNNKNHNNNNHNIVDIGPDQYISYHRDRTQSDTTKFLVARKQARDKARNSPFFRALNPSRHHSACLDDSDDCLDTRLLIWKDPKRGTRIYRLSSNSQRLGDSDEFMHPDQVYTKLLDKYTCYDVIPSSSKIVVFDSRLSVKKAFLALANDGVKAAVLWDTKEQDFTGMLTITDFIRILFHYYTNAPSPPPTTTTTNPSFPPLLPTTTTDMRDLENDEIYKWKDVLQHPPLLSCAPEDSLLKALKLLCEHRVHRLLVLDGRLGNAINVLTHKRLLAFVHFNMISIEAPPFMNNPLSSFPLITIGSVTTITYDTKLIQVLKLFIEQRISAVPVVDGNGRLVNLFAKFDFSRLAYDKLYSNLDRPVRDVINADDEIRAELHTVQPHISLSAAIHKIATASVHRLVMVDDERRVVGMATLSDLLRCLVLQPEVDVKKS